MSDKRKAAQQKSFGQADTLESLKAEIQSLKRIVGALMHGYATILEANFRTGQVTVLQTDGSAFSRLGVKDGLPPWDELAALYVEHGVYAEDRLKVRRILGKQYLQEHLLPDDTITREYRNDIGLYGEIKILRIDEDSILVGFREKNAEITERIGRIYTDSLTQVKNRKYYDEELATKICQALVMADLDSFKEVNDTYGHPCGDAALTAVASALRACVRAEDDLVRYGGDEFLIVFRHITPDALSERVVAMRQAVKSVRLECCPTLRLSMSFGVAHGIGQVMMMLPAADALLYESKKQKDCFTIRAFSPRDAI